PDLRVDLAANGRVTFNAPLTFDRAGRKSDLALAGTLMSGPGGPVVDARVTGEYLAIDDVQPLVAPLLAAPIAMRVAAGNAAGSGTARPFWPGLGGRCALAFKRVAYGDKLHVADIS